MTDSESFIHADLELARRLERAEARSNAEFVEARAKTSPDSGAEWIEVAGAYAMFDGVASPLTQTFGLGLFEPVTRAEFERIEEFFRERGAPVFHEVSPLAESALLDLLNGRGYRPIEFTSVMFRPLPFGVSRSAPRDEGLRVRVVGVGEHELWARTAARGWGESPELADFMLGLARVSAERSGAVSFLAELEGEPIATGALSICEGVALLAGASTVPEGRRRGAQLALLESRLSYAAGRGCDLAMMCAQPGSASQRNAERQGFRIAYTRIKWRLSQGSA
ncbi:MAG TPA: GNAT family N-acetyltransferase [Pyrinomonadaceae bacterium]|jgi:GNAT superfamily N-acetyltransferase|nr:GNAT family N-acetyltransferase [Pyrinomonadaceae bacterium]